MNHQQTGEERFVWPPAAPGAVVESPAVRALEPGLDVVAPGAAWRRWIIEVERGWMAPTAEPLARRMERAGWKPDGLDVYCNRCGMTMGPHEGDEFGCAACRDVRWPWERFVRLGEYRGELAEWVKEVKFTRWRALGAGVGRLLGRAAREAGATAPEGARVAVVPVPTWFGRRVSRGVDHARAIARGVAAELEAPLVDALRREKRPSQRAVAPSERMRNVAGAFRLRRGVDLTGWRVVLVDDVRTTGATLATATRALRAGGGGGGERPRVWAAAVAVTPQRGRAEAEGEGVKGVEGRGVFGGKNCGEMLSGLTRRRG